MDSFIIVLVVCLTAGLAFLLGSLFVVARLPKAANETGDTTISWNGITFKTSSVFVGLTVVSAAFGLALPLTTLFLNSKIDDMPIDVAVSLANVMPGDLIAITHSNVRSDSSAVTLRLFKSKIPQSFTLTTEHTGTVQIDARYEWIDKRLVVRIKDGSKKPISRSIAVDGGLFADLGDLTLPPAVIPAVERIHTDSISRRTTIPRKLASTGDPVLTGDAR